MLFIVQRVNFTNKNRPLKGRDFFNTGEQFLVNLKNWASTNHLHNAQFCEFIYVQVK